MILGTSGGGKTSLLNVIGTIDRPTKGKVSVCGTVVTERSRDAELAELRLRKLGFVFQTFNLIGSQTAVENVELPMTLKGVPAAERRQRATALLDMVGLKSRYDHFPNMLSGGEQQRVTIARAVANHPELLLLDEPTGDLDTKNGKIVMQLLLDLNSREDITMVMVTHDVALTAFAKRVIRLRDGKISGIEVINPALRRAACAAHRAEVDAIESAMRGGERARQEQAAAGGSRGITERRAPTDYPSFRYHLIREEARQVEARESQARREVWAEGEGADDDDREEDFFEAQEGRAGPSLSSVRGGVIPRPDQIASAAAYEPPHLESPRKIDPAHQEPSFL
jgi:ABC-type lipoprotein export system ATPase subunit